MFDSSERSLEDELTLGDWDMKTLSEQNIHPQGETGKDECEAKEKRPSMTIVCVELYDAMNDQ